MFLRHVCACRDGGNPTLLYGYGGFNVSLTPKFSAAVLGWLEMGGLSGQPSLRGAVNTASAGTRPARSFRSRMSSMISSPRYEWLIAVGTHPSRSWRFRADPTAGCQSVRLTQRPELYGAALPAVGVMDMLRFDKFTIGWSWTDDYGSSDDRDQFRALLAYSPLHNIKTGTCYPPTLITTADHDDRVVPGHSFKFARPVAAQS